MSNVYWMPSALDDLRNVHDYIAVDSAYYANKFVDDVFDKTERLECFPKSGRVVPELGIPSIREIGYRSYRIIYELVENKIQVLTVIHARQLLPNDFI